MMIVFLLLVLLALFAVFTYYIALMVLWGLALLGVVIMGISAAVGMHFGPAAGYVTGFGLVAAILTGWCVWQEQQAAEEKRRQQEEERRRREETARHQAWATAKARSEAEARNAARQRSWQERSVDDWLKVWFS